MTNYAIFREFTISNFQYLNIMEQKHNNYDLEEKTAKFGEDIIKMCKKMKLDYVFSSIISQLIRSATSIGANYCEANNASSKKDFRNKIFICKKECQETKHWLRMLKNVAPDFEEEIKKCWQEAHELTLIFQKITSKL